MKLYQVVEIRPGEEFIDFQGFDLDEALKAKEDALYSFEKMHEIDKKKTTLDFRVYDVSDDIDVLDSDAVASAVCDCYGYDEF